MTSQPANTNSNRGYLAAFGSSLFLATTGIFIRYLTVNFKLPALVLTFWREFFVALALLVAFTLFSSPPCSRASARTCPTLALTGWCWRFSTAPGRYQWHSTARLWQP